RVRGAAGLALAELVARVAHLALGAAQPARDLAELLAQPAHDLAQPAAQRFLLAGQALHGVAVLAGLARLALLTRLALLPALAALPLLPPLRALAHAAVGLA